MRMSCDLATQLSIPLDEISIAVKQQITKILILPITRNQR